MKLSAEPEKNARGIICELKKQYFAIVAVEAKSKFGTNMKVSDKADFLEARIKELETKGLIGPMELENIKKEEDADARESEVES